MNHGRYLEEDLLDAEPSDFCIGVGGYPEKHFEAPNLRTDVRGTQEEGRGRRRLHRHPDVLRQPALLPLRRALPRRGHHGADHPRAEDPHHARASCRRIPRNFHVDIPRGARRRRSMAAPGRTRCVDDRRGVGAAAGRASCSTHGVPALHFYIMQSAQAIKMLMGRLKLVGERRTRPAACAGTMTGSRGAVAFNTPDPGPTSLPRY